MYVQKYWKILFTIKSIVVLWKIKVSPLLKLVQFFVIILLNFEH